MKVDLLSGLGPRRRQADEVAIADRERGGAGLRRGNDVEVRVHQLEVSPVSCLAKDRWSGLGSPPGTSRTFLRAAAMRCGVAAETG